MQLATSVSKARICCSNGLPSRIATRYPRKRSNTVTAVIVSRPKSVRYSSARLLTRGFPRLSSDSVSVSSTTGSLSSDSALPLTELSGDEVALRSWNIGETGSCQREDPGWPRSDIDILAVVAAQQCDHLSLETPAASLCIRGDFLSQRRWDPNGACNCGFLRIGCGTRAHKPK